MTENKNIILGQTDSNNIDREIGSNTNEMNKDVELFIMNLEEEMEKDLSSNNGFIITDKKGFEKSKDRKKKNGKEKEKNVRTENGIYSPKFGTIFGDENAFEETYSCNCGELKGTFYKGTLCTNCNTTVEFKDKNVNMTGWFILNNYKVIHPEMFEFLTTLIGTKILNRILDSDWKSDDDGTPIKPEIKDVKNTTKYDNIGMIEFEHRFDEICTFFLNRNKAKREIYDFIMENRDKVFTSALPVYVLFLRPIMLSDEDLDYLPINRKYAALSTKIYNLNNKYDVITVKNEKIVNKTLYSIQKKYGEVIDLTYKAIVKKNGHVRNNILGSRYNHTGRFVIAPLSKSKINEVEFPYLGFLTEFKPEIINVLTELYNITISEALQMWSKAYHMFDQRVYDVMDYIVKNHKVYILLNRNPTLNYGSILRMRIKKVKKKYTDLSLSIPINILPYLAGDFDGDSLNTVSIKETYIAKSYELYDPRCEMIISKNDGLFDSNVNLIKEQLICLHEFCMIAMDNGARKKRIIKVGEIKEDGTVSKKKHIVKIKKKKKIHKIKVRKRV